MNKTLMISLMLALPIFVFAQSVQPLEGPPIMLSRLPMPTTPAHGQGHLDDYGNIRINSDASGQLQNEEMVCVNPLNPNQVVAVWRDFRLGYRRVGVGYSTDGGYAWQDDLFPQMYYPWQSDPVLTVDAEGIFTAMMISYDPSYDPAQNGLLTIRSSDGGQTWHNINIAPYWSKQVFFTDYYHGWICGCKSILYTNDGGESWTQQYWQSGSYPSNCFNTIYFIFY